MKRLRENSRMCKGPYRRGGTEVAERSQIVKRSEAVKERNIEEGKCRKRGLLSLRSPFPWDHMNRYKEKAGREEEDFWAFYAQKPTRQARKAAGMFVLDKGDRWGE